METKTLEEVNEVMNQNTKHNPEKEAKDLKEVRKNTIEQGKFKEETKHISREQDRTLEEQRNPDLVQGDDQDHYPDY